MTSPEHEPKPSFEIRNTTPDDVVALRQMHARSWLETYPNDKAGISYDWIREETNSWLSNEALAKSQEHFRDIFGNSNHLHQIAVDSRGNILGLVHVENREGHKHLSGLYVDADHHGRGIAQALMEAADQWIGDEDVDLEVVTYNARAIRFYEKHGYKIVEGENKPFKGKIPNITMIRKGAKR